MEPETIAKIRAFVRTARYGEAFKVAKKSFKDNPGDLRAQYEYAVLLSDNCYGISQKLIRKRTKVTVRMLKKLLKNKIRDSDFKSRIQNELYWFSEQPHKQWSLGLSIVKLKRWSGYYSMGVGAAMCSYNNHLLGNKAKAVEWAKRGEEAWKKFFKNHSTYYNAWAFYARCLGFQGKEREMENALRKAAKLAKRSSRYPEFQLVRKQVRKALRASI